MLIDKYMASFDVRDYREVQVVTVPAQTYATFRSLDLTRSRLVRTLFAIRTIPARLRDRSQQSSAAAGPQPFLKTALAIGWAQLEEVPHQELVVGAVTQPWAPVVRFQGLSARDFLAFAEPGFVKIAWNIAVRPDGRGGSVASTETRVASTDPISRRRFRRYWFVFGPGIRLIHRAAVKMLRKELERAAPPHAA